MTAKTIQEASHWWFAERRDKSIDRSAAKLLYFLFQTLDALHFVVSKFPNIWVEAKPPQVKIEGKMNLVLNLPVEVEAHVLLRAAISLAGDSFCLLKRLDAVPLLELDGPIRELLEAIEPFREIRNYFAHLDDRLSNSKTHGITGKALTNCGITYAESAEEGIHLVLSDNTLHFTASAKPWETDVSRDAFIHIFHKASHVYDELTNHKLHATDYLPGEKLYSL